METKLQLIYILWSLGHSPDWCLDLSSQSGSNRSVENREMAWGNWVTCKVHIYPPAYQGEGLKMPPSYGIQSLDWPHELYDSVLFGLCSSQKFQLLRLARWLILIHKGQGACMQAGQPEFSPGVCLKVRGDMMSADFYTHTIARTHSALSHYKN